MAIMGGSLDSRSWAAASSRRPSRCAARTRRCRASTTYDLSTYGVELFLSKGFGPMTPYIAAGRARSDAEGRVTRLPDTSTVT